MNALTLYTITNGITKEIDARSATVRSQFKPKYMLKFDLDHADTKARLCHPIQIHLYKSNSLFPRIKLCKSHILKSKSTFSCQSI